MVANLHLRIIMAVEIGVVCGAFLDITAQTAVAQLPETQAKQDADLIVVGDVTSVFQNGDEHLCQILVQRSEVPSLDVAGGARFPAPGEYVYVHVDSQKTLPGRFGGLAGNAVLPKPQTRVLAVLTRGERGRWQAVGKTWYEENPELFATRKGPGISDLDGGSLGVSSERISLGRDFALRVNQVVPDSPAARAGIEPGDVLVKANGMVLTSQDQLSKAFRLSRSRLALTVRDVRTGKDVLVDVQSNTAVNGPGVSNKRLQPLGVKTELAFYNGEAAVKVTSVEPNSPAQRAGVVSGLLILKANGISITKPEQLSEAEQDSRGRLELQVVNPRDRREQILRVDL